MEALDIKVNKFVRFVCKALLSEGIEDEVLVS